MVAAFVLTVVIWFFIKKIQSMSNFSYIKHHLEPYLYMSGNNMSRVLERCGWTTSSYVSQPWLNSGNSHFKLAIARAVPLSEDSYERELLLAPNSSTISIDWFNHPEEISKRFHGLLVVFAHCLNGSLLTTLINSALRRAGSHKLSVCVVTVQGTNGVALSSDETGMSLSFIIEFKAATDRINQHLGASFPKAAVACSIGGIPVVEFLEVDRSAYSSLILVSCPLDLGRFLVDENEVTDYLLSQGKQVLKDNADVLTRADIEEFSKATEATNLHDFLAYTVSRPRDKQGLSFLLRNVDPYKSLDTIRKPTLMIYALDDESIQFTSSVDLIRLCRNTNIAVAVTEEGGHCGFQTLESDWLAECICEFASSASKPVL